MNGQTMNSSHMISAGSALGFLTQALVYLTHWPWQPMDVTSATPFAGLLILIFAPLIAKRVNAAVANGAAASSASTTPPAAATPAA